jgi:hypothetical protein
MQHQKIIKWTVLVYTMVLVVLGVFMATVVLNVATELSIEYNNRNIEISLMNIIETKGDLSMKYAKELNNTGSGFVDLISCPDNMSMSWTTLLDTDIDTQIRYLTGSVLCLGTHDSGWDLILTFNSDFNDLEFANYQGHQIPINSWNLTGTFGDSDTSFLDLWSSAYITADLYDDNFDSDNYNIFSTGSIYYPDGYIDNDAGARALNYGYISEDSWLYSVLWSNTRMKDYIAQNSHNNNTSVLMSLWQVVWWYLKLDINASHRIVVYEIDNDSYNETNELIIQQTITGTGQLGWVWYLQSDLTLDSGTGSAYNFDFVNNDYAVFIENTSSEALLYQIRGEDATSGSGIYLNPLKDDDIYLFSFLWSHMVIDEEWRLIWDQFEVFWLK